LLSYSDAWLFAPSVVTKLCYVLPIAYDKRITINNNASAFNPNRSLDRYCELCYGEDNFLSSFILLLASFFRSFSP